MISRIIFFLLDKTEECLNTLRTRRKKRNRRALFSGEILNEDKEAQTVEMADIEIETARLVKVIREQHAKTK